MLIRWLFEIIHCFVGRMHVSSFDNALREKSHEAGLCCHVTVDLRKVGHGYLQLAETIAMSATLLDLIDS